MSFTSPKPGGWAFGEILTSAQMNTFNTDHPNAIDGLDGGSYDPTSALLIGGMFSPIALSVYNVIAYGATGLGVADDLAAIQDAVDACETAGGGTVYFPAGTYLITNEIVLGAIAGGCSLVGAGPDICTITIDHASNDILDMQGGNNSGRKVEGISFAASQANTGVQIRFDGSTSDSVLVNFCKLGGTNAAGPIFRSSAAGTRRITIRDCQVRLSASVSVISETTANNQWVIEGSYFKPTLVSYAPASGMFNVSRLQMDNSWVDCSDLTSGTWNVIRVSTSNTPLINATNNVIQGGGGSTAITWISVADALAAGDLIVETGNIVGVTTLYAMTFDGSESMIQLDSRKNRRKTTALSSSPTTMDLLNYGIHELTWDTDSSRVCSPAAFGPIGSEATIVYTTTGAASTNASLSFDPGGSAGVRGLLSVVPSSATDQFQMVRATMFETNSNQYWGFESVIEDQAV
jgi:hypothetical protein